MRAPRSAPQDGNTTRKRLRVARHDPGICPIPVATSTTSGESLGQGRERWIVRSWPEPRNRWPRGRARHRRAGHSKPEPRPDGSRLGEELVVTFSGLDPAGATNPCNWRSRSPSQASPRRSPRCPPALPGRRGFRSSRRRCRSPPWCSESTNHRRSPAAPSVRASR